MDARLASKAPHEELVRSGILLEQTPTQHSLERAVAADRVKRRLEKRPSVDELIDQGVVLVRAC